MREWKMTDQQQSWKNDKTERKAVGAGWLLPYLVKRAQIQRFSACNSEMKQSTFKNVKDKTAGFSDAVCTHAQLNIYVYTDIVFLHLSLCFPKALFIDVDHQT